MRCYNVIGVDSRWVVGEDARRCGSEPWWPRSKAKIVAVIYIYNLHVETFRTASKSAFKSGHFNWQKMTSTRKSDSEAGCDSASGGACNRTSDSGQSSTETRTGFRPTARSAGAKDQGDQLLSKGEWWLFKEIEMVLDGTFRTTYERRPLCNVPLTYKKKKQLIKTPYISDS